MNLTEIIFDDNATSLSGLFSMTPDELIARMDTDQKLQSVVYLITHLSNNESVAHAIAMSTSIITGRDMFRISELAQYWYTYLTEEEVLRFAQLLIASEDVIAKTNEAKLNALKPKTNADAIKKAYDKHKLT